MSSSLMREDVLAFVAEARGRGLRPDLTGVDLCNANLRGTNLRGVDLCNANLRGVDLRGVDLRGVDLCNANLRNADLWYADLRNADLRGTNLRNADLRGTNLRNADLRGTNLRGTNLRGTDLRGTNLRGTNLRNAKWDGLVIDGLHPCRILLTPTLDGWWITIGCWSGTPDQLRDRIAQDNGWPEAKGKEIARRRPLLEAALHVIDAHITAHPNTIDDLKGKWDA